MRVGIVTGCGQGIGLSLVKSFLESDHSTIIYGISRSFNSELETLLRNYPDNFLFHELDIMDYNSVKILLRYLFYKDYIPDFCICNAGTRSRRSILNTDLETYSRIFNINTLAQINITKTLIEIKIESNRQQKLMHILYLSSIVGSRGFTDLASYALSKSALEGFCRSAAVELANLNILLNCLSPGFVASSYKDAFVENYPALHSWILTRTPLQRWGTCDEIAHVARFLVSELNTFMTGSVVACDGGWTCI
jgi:3-oxoacyl-[acyl-carrier protein] reductase